MKNFLKKLLAKISPQLTKKLMLYRYENYVLPKDFVKHVKRLRQNDVVIDVGANIGLVSQFLAKSGAKVIALEPNTTAFKKLKVAADQFPNMDARNVAAGVVDRKVKLYLHKNTDLKNISDSLSQSSSLLRNKPNVSSMIFEEVNEIDFAEFIHSLKTNIELIKIDIEGFEVQLLHHLLDKRTIDKINIIYVETHERKFKDLVAPTEELKARIIAEGVQHKFYFDWH
jgi:FkbM family methyltransferase